MQMSLVVEVDMSINQTGNQEATLLIDYLICSLWIIANDASVYNHRSAVGESSSIKHADFLEKTFAPNGCGFCRRHDLEVVTARTSRNAET